MKTDLNYRAEKVEYIYAITENLSDDIKKDIRNTFCKYLWNYNNLKLVSKDEREEFKSIKFLYFVNKEPDFLYIILNVGRMQLLAKKNSVAIEIEHNVFGRDALYENDFYLIEKRSQKSISFHMFKDYNNVLYKYPVIITNAQKDLIAIDGNHRISKAFQNNELDKLTFLYIPASKFMFCISLFYDAVCYCATQLVACATEKEYESLKSKFITNLDKLVKNAVSEDDINEANIATCKSE